jgi:hypothetical protein
MQAPRHAWGALCGALQCCAMKAGKPKGHAAPAKRRRACFSRFASKFSRESSGPAFLAALPSPLGGPAPCANVSLALYAYSIPC